MALINEDDTREIALQWFKYVSEGDITKALELCSDDVEFINYKPVEGFNTAMPWIGTYTGRDAVLGSFEVYTSVATVKSEKLVGLLVDQDSAAGIVHEISLIKETGREFDIEFIQLLTIRDRRIVRWKSYTDPSPILEAIEAPALHARHLATP
jgi:uncharacterized protein